MRELNFSQAEAQRYIARGRLFVDNAVMRDSAGDLQGDFQCVLFEPESRGLTPIFETDAFALFDKPSGILVHPQNRNTPYSMVDEIRFHYGKDANIVHRIDQETSGLLLSSKHKDAERTLKMLFEERMISKRYLALVHGHFTQPQAINAPLLRNEDPSAVVRLTVKVHSSGKASSTDVIPVRFYPEFNMTLVEASPHTGRQHQIRVHLFHVKHPIVGDPLYGQSDEDGLRFIERRISDEERHRLSGSRRLLLHANALDFAYEGNRFMLSSQVDFESVALDEVKRVFHVKHMDD